MSEIKYIQKISLNCSELIKKDLTCPICSKTYDRSDRLPKLLSHCHTICIKCLEGIFTQSISGHFFLCPICRGEINIPREGVSGFRTNPFLIQVLDQIDNCEVTAECSKHQFEELQYCEPCDALFCDSCDDKSHCNKSSSKPIHSSQRFSLAVKRKSKALITQADDWISHLIDADKTLAFIEEKMKEKSAGALRENDEFFTKMSSLLDKRRQEVSISIRKVRDNDLKIIHDQRQWIRDEKAKVTARFKRFKHQGTISEVKKGIESLQERAESKKGWLIPRGNCSLRYVENREVAERAEKAIQEWGGFRKSKTLPSLCEVKLGECFARMCSSITIVTNDFSGNKYNGDDLDAICATVSVLGVTKSLGWFYDKGDGTYTTDFTPLKPGIYQLKVTIFDCPVKNYPLEFEVKRYENSIYSTNISDKHISFPYGVKLTVNQKDVKIGPLGWTLGAVPVLPIQPTYCQLLDVPINVIYSTTSLDCSDTVWMCGENSFWRVSADREKERVSNMFSLASDLRCIELVPSYGLSSQSSETGSIDVELHTTTCFIKENIAIDEARSEVTFRHKFGNLSRMDNTVFSSPVFVRNLPWRIHANLQQTESARVLAVYLYCDGCPESSTWSCKAKAELRLIRQNGKALTGKIEGVFEHGSRLHGFPVNLNDNLEKGFIKDDSIILEVAMSADMPQGVSKSSMQYTGYVPLRKQAAKSNLLLAKIPFSFSNGANVTTSPMSILRQNFQSLRTIWLGSNNGILYILSAEDQKLYSSIKMKLPDSVVQIIHFRGKVFIALANGHCCVFIRSQEDQCWDFSKYYLIDISGSGSEIWKTSYFDKLASSTVGSSTAKSKQNSGLSCMEVIRTSIWLAQRNSIHIVDGETLRITSHIKVDNEKAQIDKMTATGGGVWCGYRSKSDQMIQFFSAIEPYEKLVSIDIRPDLKRMLIPVLADWELNSVARITALRASNSHLWVGTAAGIVLCIPFRFTSTPTKSKCDVSQAQLSLHGFGGAVKFFLQLKDGLISVGQGYRDLMIDPNAGKNGIFDEVYPHIIFWEENKGIPKIL